MQEPAYRLVHYHSLNVTIHWLDMNTAFELAVMLDKKNKKTDQTRFCISEYVSTAGINTYLNLSWNMKIHSFKVDDMDDRPSFIIFPEDWYPFRYTIFRMRQYLTDPANKDLFYQDQDGKIRCSKKYEPLSMENQMKARMVITPMVEAKGFGTDQVPGVGIYINERAEPIFMPIVKYLSFVDIMERLDPISLSVQMLALFNHGPDIVVPEEEKGYFASVGAKRRIENDH